MIVANKSDRSPDNVRPCGHFTYYKFLKKMTIIYWKFIQREQGTGNREQKKLMF